MRALLIMLTALLTLAAAAAEKPSICFIGKNQVYLEVAYLEELEAHGFLVDSVSWKEVMPHTLRRYNAIVITNFGTDDANVESGVTAGFDALRQRYVADYMKAGGGVLVYLNTAGCYGAGKLGTAPEWLKGFGVDFYAETLEDASRAVLMEPPSLRPYSIKAAWTDSFAKHPITEGVRNLWYVTGWGGHATGQSLPVVANHQWTPVVRTGPEAQSVGREDVWAELWRAKPPKGPYALLSVRPVGQGRMAVLGQNPMWTAWSPYEPALGSVIMKEGQAGKPSDFWRILENTYTWLAEPSRQMGTYGPAAAKRPPVPGDTPAVDWSALGFPAPPSGWYRGTVGAQTALSTGTGTVAEWASAAKAEGFSFLIFTEALEAMNAEKWELLKAACQGATTEDFIAYPGLAYRNAAGTHGFTALGYVDWLPADWLTDDGKRLNVDRGWSAAKGFGTTTHKSGQIMMFLTHLQNGYYDYAENPTPFWDYKLYDLLPIWSARAGKVFESNLDKYLAACAAHHNPAAYALNLMDDPAQLKGAIAQGQPHLVISADADPRAPEPATLQNNFNRFVVDDCAYKLGTGNYRGWQGPVATTGPAARLMFRGGYRWEGVEFPRYWIERHAGIQPADWYMPSWYRLKLQVDAESAAGLRDLTVYDGETVVRRFDLQGQTTGRVEFDVVQSPTRHLVAVVTDVNGHQAVAREIWLEQQMSLYNYCGDRVNCPYTVYSPIHGHPYETLDKKQLEVRRFYVDLVAPDVLMERYTTDAVYKREELTDMFGWHNWAPHHTRTDYTYEQRATTWYKRHGQTVGYDTHPSQFVHWDGFTKKTDTPQGQLDPAALDRFDNTITLKQPVTLDANGFLPLSVVAWTLEDAAPYLSRDGKVAPLAGDGGALAEGDIVIFTADPAAAAGHSLRVVGGPWAWQRTAPDTLTVGIRPPRNEAGETLTWSTEAINRNVQPSAQTAVVKLGTRLGQPLVELHVQAQDGVAVVRFPRAATDYNCQPLVVHGVLPNCTAGVYDPEYGYRPIGVFDGKAYAQLPGTRTDAMLVIGNIVRVDNPALRVEMFQDTDAAGKPTGDWQVSVHNPTDAPITTTLTIPDAFAAVVQPTTKSLTVAARSTQRLTVK